MNNAEREMRRQALEDIKERLRGGYSGYYCDLHNEVFNTDYYIIGTYAAEQALEAYGVFDAIGRVQDYEKDNFGEIYTDLSNPESVINMLYYIIGEEVLLEAMAEIDALHDNWNSLASEELNKAILEQMRD
jgi:hypothetical protein